MIRTTMTMLALGFLAFTGVSANAATTNRVHHVKSTTTVVATNEGAAPAGEEAKPAAGKEMKKAHKAKGGAKAKDKAAGAEAPSTPAPEAAPAK